MNSKKVAQRGSWAATACIICLVACSVVACGDGGDEPEPCIEKIVGYDVTSKSCGRMRTCGDVSHTVQARVIDGTRTPTGGWGEVEWSCDGATKIWSTFDYINPCTSYSYPSELQAGLDVCFSE